LRWWWCLFALRLTVVLFDFDGAALAGCADSAPASPALFTPTEAGVFESSTAGFVGAAARCPCCAGLALFCCCVGPLTCAGAFVAVSSTGSVSPPEVVQALKPPSSARAV
jgi:hypothetical protein